MAKLHLIVILLVISQLPLAQAAEPVDPTAHCDDPSNCDRGVCRDRKAFAPLHCHGHVEEMECFQNCKDPEGLAKCYEEKPGKEEYCLLKYRRKMLEGPTQNDYSEHAGLPCKIKCQVDAKFWGCVSRCDQTGCFESFRRCEREGSPPPCKKTVSKYWAEEECKMCYIHNLIDEVQKSRDCLFRYHLKSEESDMDNEPVLDGKEQVSSCVYELEKTDAKPEETKIGIDIEKCATEASSESGGDMAEVDVSVIEKCFRQRLMHRQFIDCRKFTPLCVQGEFGGPSSLACHKSCIRVLAKPYCYLPCERNQALRACKEDCDGKWPLMECLCSHKEIGKGTFTDYMLDPHHERIMEYSKAVKACATNGCYMEKIHTSKEKYMTPAVLSEGVTSNTDSKTDKPKSDSNAETTGNTNTVNGNLPPKTGAEAWDVEAVKVRNCKSKRHVAKFSKLLVAAFNKKRVESGKEPVNVEFGGDIERVANHFTYAECSATECYDVPDNDRPHCVKKCVKKSRTAENMNVVCNETEQKNTAANFLRSEILLWCMVNASVEEPDVNKTWTLNEYITTSTNYQELESLQTCEEEVRSKSGTLKDGSMFKIFASITYLMEAEWCADCVNVSRTDDYHPYQLDNAKCELDSCYRDRLDETCPKLKSTQAIVKTIIFTQCWWTTDYSLSRNPYKIWKTYFDEIAPFDVTNEIQHPNTEKYLIKSSVGETEGHFVFPYFVVMRGICEDGYYDESVYKFIASGATPVVRLSYLPVTSRQKFVTLLVTTFQSALINLERIDEEDKVYLPKNPLNRLNTSTKLYDGKSGCHLNLCYPAFVVPLVALHIPKFRILVYNQQSFSSKKAFGYASSLHARDVSGIGSLKVADRKDPPTSTEFFPVQKVEVYEDTQFHSLWYQLPDSVPDLADKDKKNYLKANDKGPDLNHLTDENCKPYKPQETLTLGGNLNLPLDEEDFMRFQYTHGNAPQAVIAGFFDPNLVIIGDPDMKSFQLARWEFEATASKDHPTERLFHGKYNCLIPEYKVRGFQKPMYSWIDRSDPDYWIQYYRMRYAPKDYENAQLTKAIFDAISLEDRILLITTGGIVSLYQNFNTTAAEGKAWEVVEADNIQRCFKIVRVGRRTHPLGDTVVGITYDYQVKDPESGILTDVNQQVWIGKYFKPGLPIEWSEITAGIGPHKVREERVSNREDEGKRGKKEDLPDRKDVETPVDQRDINPKSQIESICYKVYRSNMGKLNSVQLVEDSGWCEAIDATLVTSAHAIIQILVRMRVYVSGDNLGKDKRLVIFYVVATFKTDTAESYLATWTIDSIIPRVPCQDQHRESITSVVPFHINYFGDMKTQKEKGCHLEDENLDEKNLIFLHGITHTRSYNRHLFLYGNKLLQSSDGGKTFISLNSFPNRHEDGGVKYQCQKSWNAYHRIKLMTFDDSGHYAFLTNKRELWYGSLSTLDQIQLRPSASHSMVSMRLPEVKELTEAVPFTLFFDADNDLVEMVAVVDANGTVTRIARRSINWVTILRARFLLKKFSDKTAKLTKDLSEALDNGTFVLASKFTKDINYDPVDWSVFCQYASHSYHHNFSERHSRAHYYSMPSPRQHIGLGNAHIKTSLNTFQAAAFGLIWKAFFEQPYRAYSKLTTNPFTDWVSKKTREAVIGRLDFLSNEPQRHGILVLPDKYQRYPTEKGDENRIYSTYYLDYGVVIELTIEYSVSNDFTSNPTNYNHHLLSKIYLNVENSNGSLLQINTNREIIASRAAVRYIVHIVAKKNTGLPQGFSGRGNLRVPVYFHLIGGFGNCVPTESTGILGDSITTDIAVGCPPSTDLVLDWESTLQSIKFRNRSAHFGLKKEECYENEPFCFYVKYPLVFHFLLFDDTKQDYIKYEGKYVMRIVAGGYSKDDLLPYTTEEQQSYNIPGVSDVSLIWNEWNPELHEKVEQKELNESRHSGIDSREIVLSSGKSYVQWACHTLSPCARIKPRSSMQAIFYFKIFISNRGVDKDTLCLFEKEFIILLYGFPPSTEIQLITTVLFYILMLLLVGIAYFCIRDKKKLWKTVKSKVYGWINIIVDTFPKLIEWMHLDDDEEEETGAEIQRRRDEIILSLQGHLNVPKLVHKATTRGGEEEKRRKKATLVSQVSSISSLDSVSSGASGANVLNPIAERPVAATWTDLIYEQIISRRLARIIERNRLHQEELKRKTQFEGIEVHI